MEKFYKKVPEERLLPALRYELEHWSERLMQKHFVKPFRTLKLEEELEGLLDTTEVTKISANHEHTHIRIYLRAKRLIFKKNIWKLEKAITEQIFQNRAIQVKIIESYELSEQYTPKSLIEVYKDSILDELNAYSVLEYNLLRTADMEFPEEDRLILTMDETIIAKPVRMRLSNF